MVFDPLFTFLVPRNVEHTLETDAKLSEKLGVKLGPRRNAHNLVREDEDEIEGVAAGAKIFTSFVGREASKVCCVCAVAGLWMAPRLRFQVFSSLTCVCARPKCDAFRRRRPGPGPIQPGLERSQNTTGHLCLHECRCRGTQRRARPTRGPRVHHASANSRRSGRGTAPTRSLVPWWWRLCQRSLAPRRQQSARAAPWSIILAALALVWEWEWEWERERERGWERGWECECECEWTCVIEES